MASKLVIDRQKKAEAVVALCEAEAEEVGGGLQETLRPYLQAGETMPDMRVVMRLLGRALLASKDRLIAADVANEREIAQDAEARVERDRIADSLYGRLVILREVLTGLYGPETAAAVLAQSTPKDPVMLSRFSGEVIDALRTVELPEPRIAGASLPVSELVAELLAAREELDRALSVVAHEVRETQHTRDDKHQALEEYDERFTAVSNAAIGLLQLNGKGELAQKVRPTRARASRTGEPSRDTRTAAAMEQALAVSSTSAA